MPCGAGPASGLLRRSASAWRGERAAGDGAGAEPGPGPRAQPVPGPRAQPVPRPAPPGAGLRRPAAAGAVPVAAGRPLTRREALGLGAAVGAGALLASPAAGALARRTAPRVVVVGAGLAGLTCAHRLAQAGIPVTVYEARDRVGGRCWTARGFAGGQVAEHGGEFVDTRHVHLRRLVRELGLSLEDRVEAEGRRGPAHGVTWLDGAVRDASEIERGFGPVLARLAADARRIGDYRAGHASRAARAFDELSQADWIEANVPGGLGSLLGRTIAIEQEAFFGLAPERSSAINLIEAFVAPEEGADDRYHVRGGNDRVAAGVAARLPRGTVRLGHALLAVRRRTDGSYALRLGGIGHEVVADRLVLTLPFTALRVVDLGRAGLSRFRRRSIEQLGMGTNSKLLLQLRDRPAAHGDWSGGFATDAPRAVSWESSLTQGGREGLLTVFSGGATGRAYHARAAHGAAPRRSVEAELSAMERAGIPGVRRAFGGRAWADVWERDPFARGSYAGFLPGQYTRFWGALSRPEGRVHFAGEHTSTYSQGYLNGGVESGERAAREVRRALRR